MKNCRVSVLHGKFATCCDIFFYDRSLWEVIGISSVVIRGNWSPRYVIGHPLSCLAPQHLFEVILYCFHYLFDLDSRHVLQRLKPLGIIESHQCSSLPLKSLDPGGFRIAVDSPHDAERCSSLGHCAIAWSVLKSYTCGLYFRSLFFLSLSSSEFFQNVLIRKHSYPGIRIALLL